MYEKFAAAGGTGPPGTIQSREYASVEGVNRSIVSIVHEPPKDPEHSVAVFASVPIESRGFPSWDWVQPKHAGEERVELKL
jgi:hypothetical protein